MEIAELIEMLCEAKEAQRLLNKIYCELGPYTDALSEETKTALRYFFKFDDSE